MLSRSGLRPGSSRASFGTALSSITTALFEPVLSLLELAELRAIVSEIVRDVPVVGEFLGDTCQIGVCLPGPL
jgi:hypothetical protein